MKLQYRGVSYSPNQSTLDISVDQVQGKFRGQEFTARCLRNKSLLSKPANLVYRGVTVR